MAAKIGAEDDVDAIAEKNAVVASMRAEVAANAVVIGRTKTFLVAACTLDIIG